MKNLVLLRYKAEESRTLGTLILAHKFGAFSVERGWKQNRKRVSCIPSGVYVFDWIKSPKHGWCYEARNVSGGRTHIQIHSANWASQLLGCIALGSDAKMMKGRMGVTESKKTVAAFNKLMGKKSFRLEIRWASGALYEKSNADRRRRGLSGVRG